MEIKKALKRIFAEACFIFTGIMAVFALITWAINIGEDQVLLDVGRILLFFVFSVLLSAANGILRAKSISGGIRLTCHYALTALAFYLCFLLPLNMVGITVLVGMVIFTLLYFVAAAIIALLVSRFRRNKDEHSDYESKFKGSQKNN